MSDSLILDLMKISIPAILFVVGWQQRQISSNTRHVQKMLDHCLEMLARSGNEPDAF